MHWSQRCYGKLEELTVDNFWQIADAGDQKLRRLAHSSRWGTLELGAEDNDGLSQQGCTLEDTGSACVSPDFLKLYKYCFYFISFIWLNLLIICDMSHCTICKSVVLTNWWQISIVVPIPAAIPRTELIIHCRAFQQPFTSQLYPVQTLIAWNDIQ